MVQFFWAGHLCETQHGSWPQIAAGQSISLRCVNHKAQQGSCPGRLRATIQRVHEHETPFAERRGAGAYNRHDWITLFDAQFVAHPPACLPPTRERLNAHNYLRIDAVRPGDASSSSDEDDDGDHNVDRRNNARPASPRPRSVSPPAPEPRPQQQQQQHQDAAVSSSSSSRAPPPRPVPRSQPPTPIVVPPLADLYAAGRSSSKQAQQSAISVALTANAATMRAAITFYQAILADQQRLAGRNQLDARLHPQRDSDAPENPLLRDPADIPVVQLPDTPSPLKSRPVEHASPVIARNPIAEDLQSALVPGAMVCRLVLAQFRRRAVV